MQALILAGGSGTRFWPLSRRRRPKQLLPLDGEESLLRETLLRLLPLVSFEQIWVATTAALAPAVRREVPEVPASQVLAEPEGRNTAPAIGWAVRSMPRATREDLIAVLPADHRVADAAAFRSALRRAAEDIARHDRVMTLGVTPHRADTGFGYLEIEAAASEGGAHRVLRFVEKPDADTAEQYVASGRYLWNAGIFLFRGATLLELLARHVPALAQGLEAIAAEPERTSELYAQLPATSIDYAVMEKLSDLGTIPLACGWSDLGSWESLAEALPPDADGNVGAGERVTIEAHDNLLFAESGTIAVLGVDGLVVVRTGDTVLVLPKSRSQEVRKLIAELTSRGRHDLL